MRINDFTVHVSSYQFNLYHPYLYTVSNMHKTLQIFHQKYILLVSLLEIL